MEVGLKEILKSRGETMKEVSDETGISQNTLSLLNQGKSSGIKFNTLERLCAHLQCTPNDLLKIKKEEYTIGKIEATYKKDGLVQVPFYITPVGKLDKVYLIVVEYRIAELERAENPVFNITIGMPVHNLEYFDELYSLDSYYRADRTSTFLQNLPPSEAEDIALKNHIPGKISKIMEVLILKLLDIENSLEIVEESVKKAFATKGEDIVNNNILSMHDAIDKLEELKIEENYSETIKVIDDSVVDLMNHRLGNTIPVSMLEDYAYGRFPGATTKLEKRNISNVVPFWNKENCIECGMCSLVCPHAVIRSVTSEDDAKGIPFINTLISGLKDPTSESGVILNGNSSTIAKSLFSILSKSISLNLS